MFRVFVVFEPAIVEHNDDLLYAGHLYHQAVEMEELAWLAGTWEQNPIQYAGRDTDVLDVLVCATGSLLGEPSQVANEIRERTQIDKVKCVNGEVDPNRPSRMWQACLHTFSKW
jgi:hypothetical protein